MKLLFDEALRNNILSLISNAKEKIVLVSPYIILNESKEYLDILENKNKEGVEIELHTRPNKSDDVDTYFKNINLKLFLQKNLHAKLYFSECLAIVTSLNLIDYSIKNNIEIGFQTETKEEYNSILNTFYFPKLVFNTDENIIKYRIGIISKIINKSGKYFEVSYDVKENALLIEHEQYIIIVSGEIDFNYKVIVKEEGYYKMLKYFQCELRKYSYAFVYKDDIKFTFEILFEPVAVFRDTSEALANEDFYNIIYRVYHIKSTIAHLLYKKGK